ncbi:amino acid adenylation domain-containing protein [Sphaerisporangium aureirubrum]|uniref:Amino acid adenylation domain-containing protein n=1 Tax=Sphaerisporangium aureirubrum TaxID=1544736 RepID=A0ABW1NQC1_9ACTN
MNPTSGRAHAAPPPVLLPADRPRRPGAPAGPMAIQTYPLPRPAAGTGRDDLLLAGLAALLHRYTGQTHITLHRTGPDGRPEHVLLTVPPGSTLPDLEAALATPREPTREPATTTIRSLQAGEPATTETRFPKANEPATTTIRSPQAGEPATAEIRSARAGETATIGICFTQAGKSVGVARARELELVVRRGDAALTCHYDAGIFDAGTVERLLGHYRTLVEDGTRHPDRAVARLSMMTDAERRRVLVDWNRTGRDLPSGCLHEAFEAAAARDPEATAVVQAGPGAGERWTYRRIDAAADRLARRLRSAGVGPGTRAGVCLDRSPLLLVAVLGVLKAGGGYVPLDPGYPTRRLAAMAEGSSCALVISRQALAGNLPAERLLLLDSEEDVPADPPEDGLVAGPDDLCYVIHTSGSTGEPKPIALRHRGVMNNIADLNDRFAVGPGDAVLALSSPSFDMSVYEFLGVTAAGGTVVVPDPARAGDPAHWAELIAAMGVTVWNSAPALLGLLADHLEQAGGPALPGVRLALLGGDWVPVTLPDRIRRFMPDLRLVVMGGATEASIHSTIYEVGTVDPGWTSIPYGRPMANQRVYILDDALQPVPPEVAGELYLAGIGLARGYLDRPEQTAERFFDWSCGEVTGERVYRTGDLARFRPDGLIELLGRADFQLKINGLRVEPGEIEAVLRSHPAVREAAVVARDGRLVAYVAPGAGHRELRDLAASRLPGYMVPAEFVSLDRLPLSPNGKLDRRALPAPATGPAYRAPRSDLERALTEIYADVLGRDRVGADDDFLALGGDSVRAIQVMTRARTRGIAVTSWQVLEQRTAAELARAAAGVTGETPVDTADDGEAAPAGSAAAGQPEGASEDPRPWRHHPHEAEVWPLTPLQAGMVFESALGDGGADPYHLQTVYHLSGPVEPARLRAAGRALLDRHGALRAGFVTGADGTTRQVVPDRLEPPWRELDLGHLAPDERERRWRRFLAGDRAARFDLAAPPLLRMTLARFGDGHARLVLSCHHALLDGWSQQVLGADLLDLYHGAAPAPSHGFRDFLAWSRRRDADRSARAWADHLAGVTEPTLLAPATRPRTSAGVVAEIVHALPPEESERQAKTCAALGVTPNTLTQCAWGLLVSALTGRRDVVFGATVSGRSAPLDEVETAVGLFINTVPVRIRWAPGDTAADLLTTVQKERTALIEHEHHGLAELHRAMGLPALFDTLTVFQSYPTGAPAPGAVRLTGVDSIGTGSYPLSLLAEGDRLVLQHDEHAFARPEAEAVLTGFRSAVRWLIEDAHRPLGAFEETLGDVGGLARRTGAAPTALPVVAGASREPRTPQEEALCAIFADVLGVERVGIDDDFFALGGDSLKATRIAGRIRRTLGLEATIRTLFEHTTVAKISGNVRTPVRDDRPSLRGTRGRDAEDAR